MFLVRLACVKHAASVHPEPGSNSPWIGFFFKFLRKLTFFIMVTIIKQTKAYLKELIAKGNLLNRKTPKTFFLNIHFIYKFIIDLFFVKFLDKPSLFRLFL